MASKGVCCAAQAAGDLGKPLVISIHKKDGTVTQRCGVCEIRPSCSNAQKLVFAFRFLKGAACGLLGASKCTPSAAGIAQYNATATSAATVAQSAFTELNPPVTFAPYTGGPRLPYAIPQS